MPESVLLQHRQRLAVSLQTVADEARVPKTAVFDAEHGTPILEKWAARLADYYDVPVESIPHRMVVAS